MCKVYRKRTQSCCEGGNTTPARYCTSRNAITHHAGFAALISQEQQQRKQLQRLPLTSEVAVIVLLERSMSDVSCRMISLSSTTDLATSPMTEPSFLSKSWNHSQAVLNMPPSLYT